MQAADILRSKGINVMVFEASENIGGRIRSVRQFEDAPFKPDFPVELGAERIFGSDSKWAQLVGQVKASVADFHAGAFDGYLLDGAVKTEADVQTDPDFTAAQNFLNSLADYSGADVTVQQAVQSAGIQERVYKILNSRIGNRYGTSNDRLGIKGCAEALGLLMRNTVEQTLTSNPMQDVLTSRFDKATPVVRKNAIIKSIDYSDEAVLLTDQLNETIRADKVIVTVPLSVLKAGDIHFNPGLPSAKISAMNNFGMDASIRVVLDFKKNFWGNENVFLFGGTTSPEYFTTGIGRSEFNKIMSITINGPQAEQLSLLGDDVIPVILEELDLVLDGQATTNIRRDTDDKMLFIIQDWYKEPFIKGYASYPKPGATNQDRATLAAPVNDVLFFAGEATDVTGEAGTVSGALLSGERVAQEVIDSILQA